MTSPTTCLVTLPDASQVDIAVSDYGDGQPFLLLHGAGGPDTVTGCGEHFAKTHDVAVIAPTLPGFGGTARPGALTSIRDLASLYVALIGQLGLDGARAAGCGHLPRRLADCLPRGRQRGDARSRHRRPQRRTADSNPLGAVGGRRDRR